MALIPKQPRQNRYHAIKEPHKGRKHKEKRYNSRRWRAVRATYLAHNPICVDCDRLATVCDHITPVRQGGSFWYGPFQSMCKHCHAVKSGKETHQKNK